MQRSSRRIPAGVLLLALVHVAGGALAQPQSRDQQRCITALNGGFAKVARTRSKALLRCARAATKGDSALDCVADAERKLQKALAKLDATEAKRCAVAPDFGPGDPAALGGAALELADAGVSDLFGLSLDAAIANRKEAKDTARCQLAVAKAAERCALARVQAFNRCKKAGLNSGSIASAEDLATCLGDDAGGRLARACTARLAKAADRCAGVDLASAFPACGVGDAAGLAACADGRLACRADAALADADEMDVPRCGSITPEADAAHAATESIGPEGGEVTAVGGDGTVYRLGVPAGALLSETAITITPVSAIPDLPLTGGLLAAALLAPDGLQLRGAARVTLELPAAPAPGAVALTGFGWAGAGEGFHRVPFVASGAELGFAVTHFSGVGAAFMTPGDLATPEASFMSTTEQQFVTQLAALGLAGETDPAAWAAVFRAWYDAAVGPLLEAGTASDDAAIAGLAEFEGWRGQLDFILLALGFADDELAGTPERREAGLGLAAAALRESIVRGNAACLAEHTVVAAERVLQDQAYAETLGVATADHGLDLESVLDAFCLEILYDEVSYDQAPQIGVPGLLQLVVQLAFRDGVLFEEPPIAVHVEPTGTVEGTLDDFALGGVWETTFTPAGGVELSLVIDACLETGDELPVFNGRLCQSAIVVRGFEVTPESAELEPGGEQDFDALLFGSPHPSVSWSATGGTIDANGLYTAGEGEGTFTVTASSNTTPGLSQSATVTIGPGSGGGTVVVVNRHLHLGVHCQADLGFDGGPTFNEIVELGAVAGAVDRTPPSCSATAADVGASATSMLSFHSNVTMGAGGVSEISLEASTNQALVFGGGPTYLPAYTNGQAVALPWVEFEVTGEGVPYQFSASANATGLTARAWLAPVSAPFNTDLGCASDDDDGAGVWCAERGSGTADEVGVLPAGVYQLQLGAGGTGSFIFSDDADVTLTFGP